MMSHTIVIPGFVLAEKLGSGSYATVYKAFRKGAEREVVAIKCVEKATLTKPAIENLLTEIAILKKLKHEFIVEMKDFQWNEKYIFIIMEYCSGGDLSNFIRRKNCLPEKVVKRFLQQMASALKFLRSQNISHMDLKPQNILLSSKQDPVLKLADFGFAQYLNCNDDATSLRGSPLYMAPEILLHHKYDARVDLWSVGVILFECLFGQAPYSSRTFSELAEKIKNPKAIEIPYGVSISQPCRNLLKSLLERDPEKRISFEDFFNHEFIDLEHMPSADSYDKAVGLLVRAVTEDEAQNYSKAVKLYCEALRYLVPVIEYEKNHQKKAALREKAKEYVVRAEQLKRKMKPHLEEADISLTPFEELVQLSGEMPHLQAALTVMKAAEQLEKEEKFEEALEKYTFSLNTLIPILSDEPKGRRKELLCSEVQRWMNKAEEIKYYLSLHVSSIETGTDGITDSVGSLTLRQQCVLQ